MRLLRVPQFQSVRGPIFLHLERQGLHDLVSVLSGIGCSFLRLLLLPPQPLLRETVRVFFVLRVSGVSRVDFSDGENHLSRFPPRSDPPLLAPPLSGGNCLPLRYGISDSRHHNRTVENIQDIPDPSDVLFLCHLPLHFYRAKHDLVLRGNEQEPRYRFRASGVTGVDGGSHHHCKDCPGLRICLAGLHPKLMHQDRRL